MLALLLITLLSIQGPGISILQGGKLVAVQWNLPVLIIAPEEK